MDAYRLFSPAFLFLLLLFFPAPLGAQVAGFAFTSPASFGVSERVQISVQSQGSTGEKTNVAQTTCLRFLSSSATGVFSSSNSSWEPVSALVVTMSKNSANRTIYYADTTSGNYTLSLRAVYRPEEENRSCASWPVSEWPVGFTAAQSITVTGTSSAATSSPPSLGGGTQESASSTAPAAGQNSTVAAPSKPQILVEADIPAQAIVGAEAQFTGRAFGLKKEPLTNGRFIWTFGDGSSGEGQRIQHAYHYPSTYVVMVEASSGEWSATARGNVSVAEARLSIPRVVPGPAGLIEIRNDGAMEVDLSRWYLWSGGAFFTIPAHTVILSKQTIPFSSAVTNLAASEGSVLLYPNGSVAVRYTPPPPSVVSPALPEVPAPQEVVIPVFTPQRKKVAAQENLSTSQVDRLPVALPEATSSVALLAAVGGEQKGIAPWLWGTLLLALCAIVGYVFLIRMPQTPDTGQTALQKEAEQYELIE